MRIVVVIPTYNEKRNIGRLIPRVFEALRGHPDAHVLVMDDSSPDGTGDAVKGLQPQFSKLHLQTGTKQGLGAAYLRGFKYALDVLNADVIVQMDADFSHDPRALPLLIRQIEAGHDVAIGSRYIPGGRIPDWPAFRRLTSWGANTLSRLVAGLWRVKDCTGGFRAIRADALRKLDFRDLSTPGYAFQITTLYELMAAGAKVSEVPITFRDRKAGQTKITAKEYVESFTNLLRLRLKRSARLVKFGLVGASGIVVNEGLLFLLVEGAALKPLIASPIAIEASIISNFLLNAKWTFRKSRNQSPRRVKFLKFQGITLVSLAINYAAFAFLHAYAHMHYLLANLFGIVLAFFWNYFVNVRWTWREP